MNFATFPQDQPIAQADPSTGAAFFWLVRSVIRPWPWPAGRLGTWSFFVAAAVERFEA